MGQNIADSARQGAINQAGELGAAVGAGAVSLAGQALQRVGGAVRDGVVRTFDWEDGLLWRAADAMGDRILYPFGLGRQGAAAQALAEPLLGGMEAAEAAELGAAGLGALEGAEAGVMGGPFGKLAGATIGAAGSAGLASFDFRYRESTEQRDHFLDAQTLNGQNASVRPLRPRFDIVLDQREQNPGALRPRRQDDAPAYYRMDEDDDVVPTDYEPGRAQEPLRPTAMRTPMEPRLSAQSVIDSTADSQPSAPEQIRLQRRAARNRLPPDSQGPPGSYQDVMRATAAPTGGSSASSSLPCGINASAPALPTPGRNRRNRVRAGE